MTTTKYMGFTAEEMTPELHCEVRENISAIFEIARGFMSKETPVSNEEKDEVTVLYELKQSITDDIYIWLSCCKYESNIINISRLITIIYLNISDI